jgi:hypothetical protein
MWSSGGGGGKEEGKEVEGVGGQRHVRAAEDMAQALAEGRELRQVKKDSVYLLYLYKSTNTDTSEASELCVATSLFVHSHTGLYSV